MTVYVDDMEASFGRMVMCHMAADTTEELLAMADLIGVQRKWIQKPGTWQEHFDISKSKRALAVKAGARQVTSHELVEGMLEREGVGKVSHRPTPSRSSPRPSSTGSLGALRERSTNRPSRI